jgi:hypothetical protein
MGGSNEFHLTGEAGDLRVHRNAGEVHVHDDAAKTKFSMPEVRFKDEYFKMKEEIIDGGKDEAFITDSRGMKLVLKKKTDANGAESMDWSLDKSGAKVLPDGFDGMDKFVDQL